MAFALFTLRLFLLRGLPLTPVSAISPRKGNNKRGNQPLSFSDFLIVILCVIAVGDEKLS
jgi:hypothetical protein